MAQPNPLPAPRSLLFSAADRAAVPEESGHHPLNPASEIHGWMLSRRTGLERVGVNLYRVPPGKESTMFHLHHVEEEFVFVLSGRGVAEIGPEEFPIVPGDFLGFPPGTHAHNLKNNGSEDLVFLSGGENRPVEIGDFPRVGKRVVRLGGEATWYPVTGEAFDVEGQG